MVAVGVNGLCSVIPDRGGGCGLVGPEGGWDRGSKGLAGSKVVSPVNGHSGLLSIGQKGWL